jgi:hypothetical protein
MESIASTGPSASGADGNRGLLTIQDGRGRYKDDDDESRGVCYGDFDGDGGRRQGDDRSYVELVSTSPVSRTERRENRPSSSRVGNVQGRGYGYDAGGWVNRAVDARDSAHGSE